jgi:hypothetical protein
LTALFLLVPFVAVANPIVVEPFSYTPRLIKTFSALAIETGIVVFLLKFRGFRPFRFFCVYLLMNAIVFVFLFMPILWVGGSKWLAELIVVMVDALVIRQLAGAVGVQGDKCKGLSIWWALIVSAVGNAGSFVAGWFLSGRPV